MSVDTDIAEIKQRLISMDDRLLNYILHAEKICAMKHEVIVDHLKDGPLFRDKIQRLCGQMTVVLLILVIVLTGILGIAWAIISKLFT